MIAYVIRRRHIVRFLDVMAAYSQKMAMKTAGKI